MAELFGPVRFAKMVLDKVMQHPRFNKLFLNIPNCVGCRQQGNRNHLPIKGIEYELYVTFLQRIIAICEDRYEIKFSTKHETEQFVHYLLFYCAPL